MSSCKLEIPSAVGYLAPSYKILSLETTQCEDLWKFCLPKFIWFGVVEILSIGGHPVSGS